MPETWYVTSWLFLLGSFAGVALESLWEIAVERPRRFEPRAGILYLPLNPLYGAATVVGALGLQPLAFSPVLVFAAGAVGFSAVEFVASLLLERAFGVVFWDYSDRPLNLGGRVCLEFAGYWGVLALALVYVADPALRGFIALVPRPLGDLLVVALLCLTVGAAVATTLGFARLRGRLAARIAGRSGSPSSGWERLADRIAPSAAVLAAFPRMNLAARYRRLLRHPPEHDDDAVRIRRESARIDE